ncbi:MAG: 2-C-methyl-D-erythritol 4-phosphate cytidylyltransferase [Xanthomonadales bacterium]|nr:2-C-methyl-D-erythritol 4-phosphate cytidylyltransferase [Xanthomonadales bacterium]
MGRPVVHALLPAAGSGRRCGGPVLKQYLPLNGRPVLAHAIDAVNRFPEVAGLTVVVGADDRIFAELIDPEFAGIETVIGGDTRAESVLNGLVAIRERHPEAEWVLVHDAARPCLPPDCLDELLTRGLAHPDGAILAVPVQDTLKRGDSERNIMNTVARDALWAAQTPQLFPLHRLIAAIEAMLEAGETPTDEASAMEFTGARPLLVMGSTVNIKITWPGDVAMAEAWMAHNVKEEPIA